MISSVVRFELDLYHPVGQLAADASGLFLWSRRPGTATLCEAAKQLLSVSQFQPSDVRKAELEAESARKRRV